LGQPTETQREQAITLLDSWLADRLDKDQYGWLLASIEKSLKSNSGKDLYVTLGMIPRKITREDLALSPEQLSQAKDARPGWDPSTWSIAGSARILTVARLAASQGDSFGATYAELLRTSDVSESIELYSALPLLPSSAKLDAQVGEGLRSNMKAVFEAIAHRNPYPRETFDENRWNHMILKALFVDSTLAPIQGLDERANDELAGILCDYAHERWAAGRPVTCELWRCVGPYSNGDRLADLQRVLQEGSVDEQHAAALALSQSKDRKAAGILAEHSALAASISGGKLSWQAESSVPVVAEPA